MDWGRFQRHQFWALVFVSVAILAATPADWRFSPDSGVYIGSAVEMIENGRYWFNGYPNLHYYPGFSLFLAPFIWVFGVDFFVLNVLVAAVFVACLWLIRAYFDPGRYGLVGLLMPFVVLAACFFQAEAFRILSDGLFLVCLMAALLLWRRYIEQGDRHILIGLVVLVALAPLVRFQGLFVVGAFGCALLLRDFRLGDLSWRNLLRTGAFSAAGLVPFVLWTVRNFIYYTPHTSNMANEFFFGLEGLALRTVPADYANVQWVNADWKFAPFSVLFAVFKLGKNIFGPEISDLMQAEGVFLLIGVLITLGVVRWYRAATDMERVYLAVALLFILHSLLSNRSFYFPLRYWIPVLPFLMVAAGQGLTVSVDALGRGRLRPAVAALAMTVPLVALTNGVATYRAEIGEKNRIFWRVANDELDRLVQAVEKSVPEGAIVSATDRGLVPMLIGRKSYPILNDPEYKMTLRRMARYRTDYLVIAARGSQVGDYAWTMVRAFPKIFKEIYVDEGESEPPATAIFAVDLDRLDTVLAEMPGSGGGPN